MVSPNTYWDEGDVGDDFSRGGTGDVDEILVLLGVDWAGEVGVGLLEVLVETVLLCGGG